MVKEDIGRVGATDVIIFVGLETLGSMAILGNVALIVVLLKNKYLTRASFILMLSLAIADVLHGIVTTCYFYPPIVLKVTHVDEFAIRIFNIVDWTAWAITLTHMSAICLDRLVAIMLYGRYNLLITIPRVRNYSIACWVVFLTTNTGFFFFQFCCMIRPLQQQNYYSFGYIEEKTFNTYVLTYTPIEIITICILTISNPITLFQLYRRHKRKIALRHAVELLGKEADEKKKKEAHQHLFSRQIEHNGKVKFLPHTRRASTMLLEMSMKMGSKQIAADVREMAARRANRQQQRILLQISVVALIFYGYMTAYYVSFYSSYFQTQSAMIFNSFFYSTTHMINPVIYFSLNKEMRAQLCDALLDFCKMFGCRKKDKYGFANSSTKLRQSCTRNMTTEKTKPDATSCSDTSPLFSALNNYKSTGIADMKEEREEREDGPSSAGAESAEIRAIVNNASDSSDEYQTPCDELMTNKMDSRERSLFMSQLIRALQYTSSIALSKSPSESQISRMQCSSSYMEIPSASRGKYMRMSTTMQAIQYEKDDPERKARFRSMTALDCRPLIHEIEESNEEEPSKISKTRTSSYSSEMEQVSRMRDGVVASDSCALLLEESLPFDDDEDDDDIAYL